MNERGFSLVDALLSIVIMSIVSAFATRVLTTLPAQTARWHDAAESRQRLRVIDGRGARLAANAGPIVVDIGGVTARVPSLWPRRLGLLRAGAVTEVSASAVTFLARADGHRLLTLTDTLGDGGGDVAAVPQPGCGADASCGLEPGDAVLVVSSTSACGLYRVSAIGARLSLEALMAAGAGAFGPGAAVVPVSVTSLFLDEDAGELRLYDGYRSDNVMVDGVQGVEIALAAAAPPAFAVQEWGGPFVDHEGVWRGTGRLGDGPYAGTGALEFDVDQLALRGVAATVTLTALAGAPAASALLIWGTLGWR
ncbi:MAG: type II secretion system GspH family protein [Acidobacteriota bacterium]|nr:type II secretion system GspH family protein [Acidobacteriota bacterium]